MPLSRQIYGLNLQGRYTDANHLLHLRKQRSFRVTCKAHQDHIRCQALTAGTSCCHRALHSLKNLSLHPLYWYRNLFYSPFPVNLMVYRKHRIPLGHMISQGQETGYGYCVSAPPSHNHPQLSHFFYCYQCFCYSFFLYFLNSLCLECILSLRVRMMR